MHKRPSQFSCSLKRLENQTHALNAFNFVSLRIIKGTRFINVNTTVKLRFLVDR